MATKKYPWEENPDWFTPGEAVKNAYTNYESIVKPGDYQSAWGDQMTALYDQIANRPQFNYDLNADALYNQYKDQYQRLGKRAMQDSMGQASALTGGYGSTYGQAVGQQQYNQYMEQLNNIVPQLEQNAYGRYRDEGQDLYNLYGMTSQREASDYGRYQDQMTNWMNQQNMAYGQYMDALGFDYGQQQDQRNQANWQAQFDYGKQRDQVGDQQWQTQFDYGQQRDAQSQANWEKQFDYGAKSDEQKQAFSLAMTALQAGKMPPEALLAQAGIDAETAKLLTEIFTPTMGVVSGGGGSGRGGGTGGGDKVEIANHFTAPEVNKIAKVYQKDGKDALFKELEKQVADPTIKKDPDAAAALYETVLKNYNVINVRPDVNVSRKPGKQM